MICPNCQTPNRESARFCDGCGYELPAVEPVVPMRMPASLPVRDAVVPDPFDEEDDELDLGLLRPVAVDPASSAPTIELDDADSEPASVDMTFDAPVYLPVIDGSGRNTADVITEPLDALDDALDDAPLSPSVTSSIPVLAEAEAPRDYRSVVALDESASAHGSRPKLSKKMIMLIAIIIALLAAIIIAITAGVQLLGGRSVPNVVGMSQVDATYMIQEAGFRVKVEEVVSDEVEGIVLSTDPSAGSRMSEGATVTVRISIARVIPEVVGTSLEEAQGLLGESGFTNIEVTRTKSNEAADTVLSITPAALTRSRADALITLEVAEPFRVPDVTGMGQDEAVATLETEGYTVQVQRYNTEDAPEGTAVKTDPAAGTVLASGSTVTLSIAHNRSVELVELTRGFFADSPTITMDGQLYEMSKVVDVSYEGGNSCTFSITVRPIQTVTWFGTQTETRYGNYQTVNGTMTWTESNQVASVEPSIKQGG